MTSSNPEKPRKPWEIPPPEMPEQKPSARVKNFDEVNQGYSEEQVIQEASRCMQCELPHKVAVRLPVSQTGLALT